MSIISRLNSHIDNEHKAGFSIYMSALWDNKAYQSYFIKTTFKETPGPSSAHSWVRCLFHRDVRFICIFTKAEMYRQ